MITSAEAQLGKNMAILAAITTVVSFFIGAILIGPGFSGLESLDRHILRVHKFVD